MKTKALKQEFLNRYRTHLLLEERSPATVEKYMRDLSAFVRWLNGRPVTKELTSGWKEHLLAQGQAPATVNAKLSALNGLLRFFGREDCRVKFLRIQRRVFREENRELTQKEYARLVAAAHTSGREQLALLLETICSTGMRVSEVRYITVNAVRLGRVEVALKGKIRTILLPEKLRKKLLSYAKKRGICAGELFLSGAGRALSRFQIWRAMKSLCAAAGVRPSKVFPHNLRHLFAAAFYRATRDIVKLADVLGHSSVNTTRIYLLTTGQEHARQLNRLGLVN